MGRKDSKHKKKSSHKKKHKKERKRHKEKKSKHYKKVSESSTSDSSSDSSHYEPAEKKKFEKPKPENISHHESEWNDIFSDKYTTVKEKNIKKRDINLFESKGQSSRELNPYWKDGGNGLPPNSKEDEPKNKKNYDVKYLKSLLEKARNMSEVTDLSVKEIIEKEWGPIKELKQIIQDAESEKSSPDNSPRETYQHFASSAYKKEENIGQKSFMKPGEISDFKYTNTYQRNWKKKEAAHACIDEPASDQGSSSKETNEKETIIENKKLLTSDELNALAAKAMKAEIMGNTTLCEQLRKEIEEAKKTREEILGSGSKSKAGKKEEVVVLTKSNIRGMTKPCESSDYYKSKDQRKRGKGETHEGNKRLRYFLDDDKHSLKSMFEREKFTTGQESDEMFLKMAKKGKVRDSSDFDDDFLDQIRNKKYERKEEERERKKTIDEAKSKHKSLSNCRLCLDGNNIKKDLIVSVGNNCYLYLPSEESLTDGHCLISPIHHDTCGTLLDEDVWNEVQSYRKRLCRMFEESGKDVVFFENARSFRHFPHMALHCIPLDKEDGHLAPIYFKKAIMECETEWSNNKKLIELKDKDLRRSVPKGLPYFAVDFGMQGGFAHVIEDEKIFPWNFAEEIICGMLDLDTFKWKKRRQESRQNQEEKVSEFMKMWKKYESSDTKNIFTSEVDSSSSD